jgi:hypothetical protein
VGCSRTSTLRVPSSIAVAGVTPVIALGDAVIDSCATAGCSGKRSGGSAAGGAAAVVGAGAGASARGGVVAGPRGAEATGGCGGVAPRVAAVAGRRVAAAAAALPLRDAGGWGMISESGTPRRSRRRTSAGRGGISAAASARRSSTSIRSRRRVAIRSTRGGRAAVASEAAAATQLITTTKPQAQTRRHRRPKPQGKNVMESAPPEIIGGLNGVGLTQALPVRAAPGFLGVISHASVSTIFRVATTAGNGERQTSIAAACEFCLD